VTAADGKLTVFVSVLPQKYFVERIGGSHVDVSVMVGPGQSPATYEPSPRRMTELAGADLYYRVGVPFEKVWMDRVMAANPGMKILDAREGVPLRVMEPAGGHHHDYDHAQHGDNKYNDPHIWLDPRLVRRMALPIRDRLTALMPAHAAEFSVNYQAFLDELEELDCEVRGILSSLESREFMVFHPSWGYFADAYRLRQIPIESEGKEPGAKTLARLVDQARERNIQVIFVQKQFGRAQAEALAEAVGARIADLDPLAEDYPDNLLQVARVIAGVEP
jgi:zinc transport system substrate-binding protein